MFRRIVLALTLLLGLLAAAGLAARSLTPPGVVSIGWDRRNPNFGGWSGFDLAADGTSFLAISDSGWIARGELLRHNGRLDAIRTDEVVPIRGSDGPRNLFMQEDSEGISVLPDGGYVISYEGYHRVWRHAGWNAAADPVPYNVMFRELRSNGSFEAVATDADGVIYTLPEIPDASPDRYPVFRNAGRQWEQPFSLVRDGRWRAVGADFGPDGLFYLLERRFLGFGFASRIRRFDLASAADPIPGEVLYRSAPGRHGNLEGIAIWRDADARLRAVMVADDNFKPFQRSEIVEVILR